MNLPSAKTLERAFPGCGRAVRRLLESADAVREHPAAQALDRACYGAPGLAYMRLTACNAEAKTHGIEAVWRANDNIPAFEYLNTGDTYAPTLIRWADGRYQVASWGDIVERGNYV
ncbi:MAG: hypothetical protein DDT20_00842 [Firmicutes bacterium]|nr:hypothetical protein [Bacillota bacterium]